MNASWPMPAIAYTFTGHHAAGEPELAVRLLESLPAEDRHDLIRCLAMQMRMQLAIWPSPMAERALRTGAACGHPDCVAAVDVLAGRPVCIQLTEKEIESVANTFALVSCDAAAYAGVDGPAYAAMIRKITGAVVQIAQSAP